MTTLSHAPTRTHLHQLTCPHSHNLTHVDTHTSSCAHTLTHRHMHQLMHPHSHSHADTCTHTLAQEPTLTLSHTLTHAPAHVPTLTHTHTFIRAKALSEKCPVGACPPHSRIYFLSLLFSSPLSLPPFLLYPCTHTLACTHPSAQVSSLVGKTSPGMTPRPSV